jgi:hypothetical protein
MYGLTDDEIAAIREGKFDAFPMPEAALLRMTDAMADTPSNVSDDLYAELRRYFSEEQLIEFAAAAAQENYRARYNRVFDIGSDGLYRKGLRFKQHSDAGQRERNEVSPTISHSFQHKMHRHPLDD